MAKKSKKPAAQPAARPVRAAPPAARPRWPWILAAVLILVLVGIGAAAYAIAQRPETQFVSDFSAGPLTRNVATFEDAQNLVQNSAETFLGSPIEFTSERGNFTTTLGVAGVSIDTSVAKARLAAFAAGASPFEKITTYFFGQALPLSVTVDAAKLKAAFATANIEQGLKNANFTLSGKTVTIDPEQDGIGIDTTTLTSKIESAWSVYAIPSTLQIPLLTSQPTLTSAELTPLLAQAQTASALTFTLTDDYGNNYDFPLADHLDWLIPGTQAPLAFQQEAFITSMQTQLSAKVEEDPQPVTITQNDDGSYAFDGSARFGEKIDTLALKDTLETALQKAVDGTAPVAIAIPLTRTLPAVTVPDSLKALGVTDLVGVGYSDFSGSPSGRVHNINVGINQFNGILIDKDAEFSFMNQLSPVDAEHGFLPELVIKGPDTIPEYGGGMCQVSSTMFRAALYSGLPITARTNHSYAVSYYARPFGYGLDATVYDPAPDFKFLNDTQGSLLVQAYTSGNSAYYVFYGTNDGRRVTMDGPHSYSHVAIPAPVTTFVSTLDPGVRKLKEHGHEGFQTDWTRTISFADGTSKSEVIHSNYQARPEQWEEGAPAD